MVHDDEPVGLDGMRVEFDDERAVWSRGSLLVATLAGRLGIEALAGRWCGCDGSAGCGERGPQGDGAVVRDGARR